MTPRKLEFSQEPHCCANPSIVEGVISYEIFDGGGGPYIVLDAKDWAFDSAEEIEYMAAEMKKVLAGHEKSAEKPK